MIDIDSKAKRKVLKETFKEFNSKNSFIFVKPTLLLRDYNDIIQYFYFHIAPNRLICDIVVQPLYIPADGFCVELSQRLSYIGTPRRFPWGKCNGSESEYAENVKDMLSIISSDGLKWFNKVSDPNRIINELERPNSETIFGPCPPVTKTKIIGLSYLYLGDTERALPYLEEHIKIRSKRIEGVSDYVIEHRNTVINEYEDWIYMGKNDKNLLNERFNQIIFNNRNNLKLDE